MRTARRLMITVDVEAQPGRAEADHINRLIWGKYQERRGGISEMMDIADQHGAKLVFFVDYCERALYGDAMLDVGREIARRGHDSQLHSHPEFLSARFWSDRGFDRPGPISEASEQQALALIEFVCESHEIATGTPPVAYRGGGYRFSSAVLRSLSACAVRLDSSYNAGRQPHLAVGARKQFLWDSGCLEIPVSVVSPFRNISRSVEFNFGASAFASVERMLEYLDAFYLQNGEDAIAVLVLHSWSFSELQTSGYFSPPLEKNLERFSNFLTALGGRVEVVTAGDVLALSDAGLLTLGQTMALPPPNESTLLESRNVRAGAALSKEPKCPICGATKSRFEKMEGRQCPDCGSLERQRAFAVAYNDEISNAFDMRGRKLLIFSPAVSELRFFERQGIADMISVDIRPETRPDIQADICAMPQVETASQDFIFASYLMPVVHDMNAALEEIARILRPGGTFISVEQIKLGKATVEHVDEAVRIAWYGKDNYQKYRVGSYRTLGNDYVRALSDRFEVLSHEAIDPITGMVGLSYVCTKGGSLQLRHDAPRHRPVAASSAKLSPVERSFAKLLTDLVIPKGAASQSHCALPHTLTLGERDALQRVARVLPTVFGSWRELANQAEASAAAKLSGHTDATIDLVVSSDVFDFLEDISVAIAAAARVLRVSGFVLIRIAAHRLVEGNRPPRIAYFLDTAANKLPLDSKIPSMEIGREWMLQEMTRAGLEAESIQIRDEESGQTIEWFVGRRLGSKDIIKTDANRLGATTGMVDSIGRVSSVDHASCTVCGSDLSHLSAQNENCATCGSRARTRMLKTIIDLATSKMQPPSMRTIRPILGFSMSSAERKLIDAEFPLVRSVSLYGNYASDHTMGVDVRNLSRYEENSHAAVMGVLLFDYFSEMEQALRECHRVLDQGGIFLTHIAPYRLTLGDEPPILTGTMRRGENYFDYIPDGAELPTSKVGIKWFLSAMKSIGFDAKHVVLKDQATGLETDWFLGVKCTRPNPSPVSDYVHLASSRPSTDGGSSRDAKLLSRRDFGRGVVYELAVPEEFGFKKVSLALEVPTVPRPLLYTNFAEHVLDRTTGLATDTLIVCGGPMIGISDDLGKTWRHFLFEQLMGGNAQNCFTTNAGVHLIQAQGLQDPDAKVERPELLGRIFRFSNDWSFSDDVSVTHAQWHGSAAIDQAGDTIMFGEYHMNSIRYASNFNPDDPSALAKLSRVGVLRSTDEGQTWSRVLDFSPLDVRHFHTVVADPYFKGRWWASTGDRFSESRVLRSDDDGGSWKDVTCRSPEVWTPNSFQRMPRSIFRFTDMAVTEKHLIWGADDILGSSWEVDRRIPESRRAGSTLYFAEKGSDELRAVEIGIVGNAIRSLVDVGPVYLGTTEGRIKQISLNPSVFMISKADPRVFCRLIELDNKSLGVTRLTLSRTSRKAKDGVFFSYRQPGDVIEALPCLLRWEVAFH